MSTDIDLPRVIKDIASDIAGLLRDHYGLDQYSVVIGENVMGDLTRKIDIIAEDYAIDAIHKTGLKTWVVSEERGLYKLCEKPDYIVLLDPLDGSANYVSQIPFAAVSMAIYRVNGDPRATYTKPIYGVVENIFTRDIYEVFNATVFVNGVRINTYLDRDNHVFSIYSEDIDEINVIDRYFKELGMRVKTRIMGAASLEAIYAALGFINGFIHLTGKLRNIDIAVAVAIAVSMKTPLCYSRPSLDLIKVDELGLIEKIVILDPFYKSLLPRLFIQ